jgi:hypothetical protein
MRRGARLVDVEQAPQVAALAGLLAQLFYEALLGALRDLLRVGKAPAAPPVRAPHLRRAHARFASAAAPRPAPPHAVPCRAVASRAPPCNHQLPARTRAGHTGSACGARRAAPRDVAVRLQAHERRRWGARRAAGGCPQSLIMAILDRVAGLGTRPRASSHVLQHSSSLAPAP